MGSAFHLAQVNIARLREPLDTPLLADFVAALAPINAVADRSPGFVWRLQTEEGDATSLRVFDEREIIVNMSVWESLEALSAYVYRSDHTAIMRRRRTWFHQMQEISLALWWVPAGQQPTIAEAVSRLMHLRCEGPSSHAFTFRQPFGPPDAAAPLPARDDDLCPV